MKKEKVALTRKMLFSKYKEDSNIFVETGTHKGESVRTALDLGFNKVISVEIDGILYNNCFFLFAEEIEQEKVHLFLGDSNAKMGEMLDLVSKQAVFWLDGHVDGVSGDPIWGELEAIKSHSLNTHTIIIDDIPLYFGDGNTLENKLLEINSDYNFIYEDAVNEGSGAVYKDYDLIAYV
jgi:hypothetical protein